jgi:hypothetical protein
MSHRKRQKHNKDDTSKRRMKMMTLSADIAGDILDKKEDTLQITQQPGFPFELYYHQLEFLDNSKTILPRLDKKAIESIKKEDHEAFLNYFATACISGMARRPQALEVMEKYGIVMLPAKKEDQDLTVLEEYPELLPILGPIHNEYPYFSHLFLGMFQSRLEGILDKAGLLPYDITNAPSKVEPSLSDQLAEMSDETMQQVLKASELLPLRRLILETRNVLRKYLKMVLHSKDHILIDNIADISVTYVVLWLVCMGMFDEILAGLLGGKPVLHKISNDNADDYDIPKEGIDVGLLALKTEEE